MITSIMRIGGKEGSNSKMIVGPVRRQTPRKLCLGDDGCPPPSDATKRLIEAVEERGSFNSPLSPVARQRRLDAARRAIADGAEVDVLLCRKYPTLLYNVVCYGDQDQDMIRLLVEGGADINMSKLHGDDDFYWPAEGALSMALMQGQVQAAMLLVELGADVNLDNSFTTFVMLPEWGFSNEEVALAKVMFDAGGNCDQDIIEEMRKDSFDRFRLTDTDNYWEEGAPTMIDLLEQWLAERERLQLDANTSPASGVSKRQERL